MNFLEIYSYDQKNILENLTTIKSRHLEL